MPHRWCCDTKSIELTGRWEINPTEGNVLMTVKLVQFQWPGCANTGCIRAFSNPLTPGHQCWFCNYKTVNQILITANTGVFTYFFVFALMPLIFALPSLEEFQMSGIFSSLRNMSALRPVCSYRCCVKMWENKYHSMKHSAETFPFFLFFFIQQWVL